MIRYLKRLNSSMFVRVKAFPMYGGIDVSMPSLHRESTDSLILKEDMKNKSIERRHTVYTTQSFIEDIFAGGGGGGGGGIFRLFLLCIIGDVQSTS